MIKNCENRFRLKILKAVKKKEPLLKNILNGKIVINNGELHIYNEDGAINCSVIQLENKREIVVNEHQGLGFECRPIVAGNFLRNKVIDFFDFEFCINL